MTCGIRSVVVNVAFEEQPESKQYEQDAQRQHGSPSVERERGWTLASRKNMSCHQKNTDMDEEGSVCMRPYRFLSFKTAQFP
jgi:hypothetical protein